MRRWEKMEGTLNMAAGITDHTAARMSPSLAGSHFDDVAVKLDCRLSFPFVFCTSLHGRSARTKNVSSCGVTGAERYTIRSAVDAVKKGGEKWLGTVGGGGEHTQMDVDDGH